MQHYQRGWLVNIDSGFPTNCVPLKLSEFEQ